MQLRQFRNGRRLRFETLHRTRSYQAACERRGEHSRESAAAMSRAQLPALDRLIWKQSRKPVAHKLWDPRTQFVLRRVSDGVCRCWRSRSTAALIFDGGTDLRRRSKWLMAKLMEVGGENAVTHNAYASGVKTKIKRAVFRQPNSNRKLKLTLPPLRPISLKSQKRFAGSN